MGSEGLESGIRRKHITFTIIIFCFTNPDYRLIQMTFSVMVKAPWGAQTRFGEGAIDPVVVWVLESVTSVCSLYPKSIQAAVSDAEKLRNSFSSPSFSEAATLKGIQWAGHVVCMDEQISRKSNFIQGLSRLGLTCEQSYLRNE
jgi:hypothetical protein